MSDKAAQRLLSGEAWEDYCNALKLAGSMIDRFGDEPNDLERSEWYRFISRVSHIALHRYVEYGEASRDRPRITLNQPLGGLNVMSPDQEHWLCDAIDPSLEYRLRGNRGDVPYFVLISGTEPGLPADYGDQNWATEGIEGLEQFNPAPFEASAFLTSDEIEFDDAGDFEVILSQRAMDKNWLALNNNSTMVLLRIVHADRADKGSPAVTITLERLDNARPETLNAQSLSRGLAKAGQYVLGWTEWVRSWWQELYADKPNQIIFSDAIYSRFGGVLDRAFGFGRWQKPAGEALVIEFTPGECQYWNFQVCNMWQENLDNYAEEQGYINGARAQYASDGLVRIILADEDPGVEGNWIDPDGHTQGIMGLRLIKVAAAPTVTVYQVSLSKLKADGLECLQSANPLVSGQVVD